MKTLATKLAMSAYFGESQKYLSFVSCFFLINTVCAQEGNQQISIEQYRQLLLEQEKKLEQQRQVLGEQTKELERLKKQFEQLSKQSGTPQSPIVGTKRISPKLWPRRYPLGQLAGST
ncbi:MAG: hypothetical protein IPG31_00315 [Nitrosomonas sp.]|nr:hypothetical protein [Nitrosomonas sp.]